MSSKKYLQLILHSMVYLLLPYSKVFHVRSVTQGDVIRAEAKDIPRIFQVNKLVSAFFLYLFTLILFFRFCTLVKESLVNPKTTSATTASPQSSLLPVTSWWTSRSPVRVRSKIDCYKIQSFSFFTFSRYATLERARVRRDLISHARLLRPLL